MTSSTRSSLKNLHFPPVQLWGLETFIFLYLREKFFAFPPPPDQTSCGLAQAGDGAQAALGGPEIFCRVPGPVVGRGHSCVSQNELWGLQGAGSEARAPWGCGSSAQHHPPPSTLCHAGHQDREYLGWGIFGMGNIWDGEYLGCCWRCRGQLQGTRPPCTGGLPGTAPPQHPPPRPGGSFAPAALPGVSVRVYRLKLGILEALHPPVFFFLCLRNPCPGPATWEAAAAGLQGSGTGTPGTPAVPRGGRSPRCPLLLARALPARFSQSKGERGGLSTAG